MAGRTKKCKRYNGRPYNVKENIFFENYMEEVSKGGIVSPSSHFPTLYLLTDENKILAYKPSGFLSRSKTSGEYGLTLKARNMVWYTI